MKHRRVKENKFILASKISPVTAHSTNSKLKAGGRRMAVKEVNGGRAGGAEGTEGTEMLERSGRRAAREDNEGKA